MSGEFLMLQVFPSPHLLCNLNHQSGVKLVDVAAFPSLLAATHHLQRGSTELPWLHRPHQTYHVVSQLSRQQFAWRCWQQLTKTWALQSAAPLGGGNNVHSASNRWTIEMNRLIDNIKVEVCNGNHLANRNPKTTPVGQHNIEGQPLVMAKKNSSVWGVNWRCLC